MRAFRNRRVSVLATVTGISVGIAGVLLFVRFGPPVGAESPNPAEVANARSATGKPRRPPVGMPTFPSWPGRPPGSSPPSASAGPGADAPTENLRKVVAALRFTYKSTTGVLTVPPGLNLTGTVEISMLWDEGSSRPTRATQNYNNATGNRSLFLFPPGDGRARPVANVLSLSEPAVDGAYTAVRSNVTIEPLYDVTVSPLTFTLQNDCDAFDTEILLFWRSASGGAGEYETSMSEGQVRSVGAFERTYQEVGQSADLQEPTIVFYDDDNVFGQDFYGPPTSPTPPLVLGQDVATDRYVDAQNNSACVARIRYSITYVLREYLYLE